MNYHNRLKKLEDKFNQKSNSDLLMEKYDRLSSEVHKRIKKRFSPEDCAKLKSFKWDDPEYFTFQDKLYKKYADNEDLKIFKKLEEIQDKHEIETCTIKNIKEQCHWLTEKEVNEVYRLTKQGKLKEARAIYRAIFDNLTRENFELVFKSKKL